MINWGSKIEKIKNETPKFSLVKSILYIAAMYNIGSIYNILCHRIFYFESDLQIFIFYLKKREILLCFTAFSVAKVENNKIWVTRKEKLQWNITKADIVHGDFTQV